MGRIIKWRRLLFLLVFLVIFLFDFRVSYAVENDFSVRLESDTNSAYNSQNFFDLNMEPHDTDKLKILISNNGDSEQAFSVDFGVATTNINGIVDYTQNNVDLVGNDSVDIREIITIENQKIVIPANESQTVVLQVAMSEVRFNGILLGGIIVSKVNQEVGNSSSGVNNKFRYVIAVQISQGEKQTIPQLKNGKAVLNQINKRNAISMEIINSTPVLLSKVIGKFQIYDKKTGHLIKETINRQMSIAPNSSFHPFLSLNDKFRVGEYTFVVKLENSQGQWSFSENFIVSGEEASEYNQKAVDEFKNEVDVSYIIPSLLLTVFLFILLLIKKKAR